MPYVSFGPYDRHKKIVLIWVCLLFSLFLFAVLVILFYVIPVYDCEACSLFNCVPLTRNFCATQNINFKRQEPVVWPKWGTVGRNRMCICSDHGSLRSHSNSDKAGTSENHIYSHNLTELEMECVQKHFACTVQALYGSHTPMDMDHKLKI
jgi:hypothetical protein